MNKLLKIVIAFFAKLIGKNRIRKIITLLANCSGVDLLLLAHNNIGILKCENAQVSGEYFLANKIIKNTFFGLDKVVVFDVGANVGKYSLMMSEAMPAAKIYAFEPNKNAYDKLVITSAGIFDCHNFGFGSEEKTENIYTYKNSLVSSHASMFEQVFKKFHNSNEIVEMKFEMCKIDIFCKNNDIECIDFLKIDTEGNEYDVLIGAERMISSGMIKIIQFEFGECDVFSKVFLHDFYRILNEYNIYRLDSERLIPLFTYNLSNEIFRYQNFVAVRKDISILGR